MKQVKGFLFEVNQSFKYLYQIFTIELCRFKGIVFILITKLILNSRLKFIKNGPTSKNIFVSSGKLTRAFGWVSKNDFWFKTHSFISV